MLDPFHNGICANCNKSIYIDSNGTVAHTYTTSIYCKDGKKVMVKRGSAA